MQLFCWTEKRGFHSGGLPQEVIVHSVEAQKKTKQQVTPVGWRVVWIMHVEDVWDRHLRCGELVPLHLLPFCLLLLLRASELAKQEADSFQVSLEPQIILSDFEFATKQAVHGAVVSNH